MYPAGPPSYRVIVQPAARRDARATYLYYRRENPTIAQDFAQCLDRALVSVGDAPLRWAEFDPGIRRTFVPRFPITIYYRVVGAQVQVLRILDQRRHPDAWRTGP